MPADYDKEAYPEPPQQTPAIDKRTALPDPAIILSKAFYYAVDLPVTTFRDTIDSIRGKNKLVYYHRNFRRVPDLIDCTEGDYVCYYEAEMQWRRDYKVDQEIVKVIQERVRACQQREGASYQQNCAKDIQQFNQVTKAFRSRYEDLGAYANARKCLMKQKERMMAAEANSA